MYVLGKVIPSTNHSLLGRLSSLFIVWQILVRTINPSYTTSTAETYLVWHNDWVHIQIYHAKVLRNTPFKELARRINLP